MGRKRIHPPQFEERLASLCGCLTDTHIRYGLCNLHWQEWKRTHDDLLPLHDHATPGRRHAAGRTVLAATCSVCDELLPGSRFNSSRRMGFTCEECDRVRSSQSQRQSQAVSLQSARRRGFVWTGPDMELVMRDDLTLAELASMLGRTYASVAAMRTKVRHDPKCAKVAGVVST